MYFDRNRHPITLAEWSVLIERGNDYRRIARTVVDDVVVSTVWLGLNHNWDLQGEPLIFETMVFGGSLAEHQWRYATEAQARAGHKRVVALARAKAQP